MISKLSRIFIKFLFVAMVFVATSAHAVQDFVISDIRIEGLERLTAGTIFNYLPMKVGDQYNETRSGEVVRTLFKTGLFDDVRLERDGDVLVVIVKERPSIGSITLNGNEDIKSEDLIDGLRQIGFAEGRVFDQSQLDALERELRRQYFSLGKYGVKLESTVTELENNRVAVVIDISEGVAARIKQINIVGNESFKEKKLLKLFKLSTPNFLSFFTKKDQYSKQKLSADLEALRSFYLDKGYLKFNIDSTQVSITPDKKDIYITINVQEGEQYFVTEVRIAGDLIVEEEELFSMVEISNGDLFSRKRVTRSTTNLTDRLGDEGYAFANVNAVPDIDEENKTVELTFFMDPGKRVYVRRINFAGNTRTRDEVLRREMRQQEGGWIATTKVQRGKVRLQRLGFFKNVNVETPSVPGTTDQVDVNYTVEENPSGQLSAGLGFSQGQGLIFQTSIAQDNFLGSGKRINFAFNNSEVNRTFQLGYLNPYYTIDGISRGFSGFYRETDASNANVTRFDSTVWGGDVNFGIPITEFNSVFASLNYENTKINTSSTVAQEVQNFINANGSRYDILRLASSFTYDSRNKAILPDKGILHRLSAEVALPFLDDSLEFYKVTYRTQLFVELIEDYVFSFRGDVSYGDAFGSTNIFPFFENFYSGGPKSVRGYQENTLGPKDSLGRPLGGNLRAFAGAEVILPIPFLEDIRSFRLSGFFDAGNVFGVNQDFEFDELRYSAGLSGIWVSPFGVLSVSFAAPIGDKAGDDTQPVQFTFGTNF